MSELSKEQVAHDIAIAMLPHIMKEQTELTNSYIMDEYMAMYKFNLQYLTELRDKQEINCAVQY